MKKINTIFVLGYPRSGTTWFANLFNSHPDVAYRHEVIGRCYRHFPEQLFYSLKYNNGLSDAEHERAMDVVLSPNVDTDRAPFFSKNHLRINNTTLHYFSWLVAKTVVFLQPFYKKFYYPSSSGLSLIIKETRSTVNMDSMLTGLRADSVVVLFRHPCGAIASYLKGIANGVMASADTAERSKWYSDNCDKSYLTALNISAEELVALPEHKYLAIFWAQQNEDYLNFESSAYKRFFVSYEAFMEDKDAKARKLFDDLTLSYDSTIEEFLSSTSSTGSSSKPSLKDSSNPYYSVYRDEKFNPHKWQNDLTAEEIADIEKLTLGTYNKLLEKIAAVDRHPKKNEPIDAGNTSNTRETLNDEKQSDRKSKSRGVFEAEPG